MNTIAGADIAEIAAEFGTPIYVYAQNKIENNYKKMRDVFQSFYKKTKIHYSAKANSNLNILKLFNSLGSGIDCSSPVELLYAQKAGFEKSRILYTGNYEGIEDLQTALSMDVRINLDDVNSFHRLLKIKTPDSISFRINPGVGRGGFEGITTAGSDAKFGVPYEMAVEVYRMAKELGVKQFGIHMMTGSNNLEPYYFAESIDKLLTIAGKAFNQLKIIPDYIDIGGGFGIPYIESEPELNIELTARLITEVLDEKCKKYEFGEPELILEPGRYLIANAGYLISKVTGIKNGYKKFIGIDAGMNTLIRPALYGANHRISVYNKNNYTHLVNLCGQICENSDIFARNLPFPEIDEGDIVVIHDVGAYGYAMSSNYNNRLRPAEVLVDNGKARLIRRREEFEDLMRMF